MKRRNFIMGLGTAAAGSAAAMGSGAFMSAEVDRDVTVEVTTDKDAFVGLRESSEYASETSDGELELHFDDNSEGGEGVSPGSTYMFQEVFQVLNFGTTGYFYVPEIDDTDDITLYLGVTPDRVDFGDDYEFLSFGSYPDDDPDIGGAVLVADGEPGGDTKVDVRIEVDDDADVDELNEIAVTWNAFNGPEDSPVNGMGILENKP